jgi:hypothetical protein
MRAERLAIEQIGTLLEVEAPVAAGPPPVGERVSAVQSRLGTVGLPAPRCDVLWINKLCSDRLLSDIVCRHD